MTEAIPIHSPTPIPISRARAWARLLRVRLGALMLGALTLGACTADLNPDGFVARGLADYLYTEGARRKLEDAPDAALRAWQRAADAGHVKARYQLAHLYGSDVLGPRDQAQALVHARRAAEAGFAPASHYVGMSLLYGWGGVAKDPAAAEPYLRRALAGDVERARADLGTLVLDRAGPARDAGANAARAEGLALLEAAVADDDPVASWRLAEALVDGTHMPRDPARAADLLAAAIEAGEYRAALPLARLQWVGNGVPTDRAAARALLERVEREAPAHVRVDLGLALLNEGDVLPLDAARARRLLEVAARNDGRVRAHVRLGKLLAEGAPGVAPDPEAAVAHLRAAAEAGNGEATRYMGVLLEDQGRADAALAWFLEAAARGHAQAAVEGARILLKRTDAASVRQAVSLLGSVASDNAQAGIQLARVARDGVDGALPPDPGTARQWFQHVRATAGGLTAAQATNELARMLLRGQGGPEDARGAVALFGEAAAGGHGWAALELGRVFEAGAPGIPADLGAAWRWYQEAAARGVAQGHTALGRLVAREGRGPEAIREAFGHFARAAEGGHTWALYEAGKVAEQGVGGQPGDPATARAWYERAMTQGVDAAPGAIASLYERGLGVEQDDVRALALYHMGARAGNAWATYKVGSFVAEGRGTPADPDAARAWLTAARAEGVTQAVDLMERLDRGAVGPFGHADGSGSRVRIHVTPDGS
ncbi:tetratricopeptide repeat protein [Roseospira marina]|nr:SEL1-like repeat protein [Roseospira marina]MBB4313575.1 TPR repeat protein [Roseospira marina]MBB5086737.1 TPR repeat protein [Roseospira marina]